ncbi:MAG: hypothetical protein WD696_04910 [Bryobacteraceae bacterium]
METPLLRREIVRLGAYTAAALVWSGELDAACDETEDNIEGPFYKAGAPERTSIVEPGMKGIPLVITGQVVDTRCQPLAHAILDVWQCDADGVYDNKGYTLRGKVQADGKGRYEIRTIQPPPYKVAENRYRPAHLHLKVSGKGTPVLTTQLYFEGDKYNQVDRAYRKSLTIKPVNHKASFDFRVKRDA